MKLVNVRKEIREAGPLQTGGEGRASGELQFNPRGEGLEQISPGERKKGISGKVNQCSKSSRRHRAQFV